MGTKPSIGEKMNVWVWLIVVLILICLFLYTFITKYYDVKYRINSFFGKDWYRSRIYKNHGVWWNLWGKYKHEIFIVEFRYEQKHFNFWNKSENKELKANII